MSKTGGFGAGVGGKLGGDVYDQAMNGKDGFDSVGSYLEAGAVGAVEGVGLGALSVRAGRYLPGSAAGLPLEELAARFARSKPVLERVRAAGVTAGKAMRAGAARIRVTAGELREMVASGLGTWGSGANAAQHELLALPPATELEVTVDGAPAGDAQPLVLNDVQPVAGSSNELPAEHAKANTSKASPEQTASNKTDVASTPALDRGKQPTASVEAEPVGTTKAPVRRIAVKRSQLKIKDDETSKEWIFYIKAPLASGRSHLVVDGAVLLDAQGFRKAGPSFVFDKRTTLGGEDVKIDIVDDSDGAVIPLSELALTEALSLFKARYGYLPEDMPGHLAWENRSNFQREYIQAIDQGATPEAAAATAIKAISFGKHRVALGYDQVSVTVETEETIQYGDPPQPRVVPRDIDIHMRRGK